MKWLVILFLFLPALYGKNTPTDKLQMAKNKIEELENIGQACTGKIEKHRSTIKQIEAAIADLEKTNEEIKQEIRKIAKENKLPGYGE